MKADSDSRIQVLGFVWVCRILLGERLPEKWHVYIYNVFTY
jgi:hypothetical protein